MVCRAKGQSQGRAFSGELVGSEFYSVSLPAACRELGSPSCSEVLCNSHSELVSYMNPGGFALSPGQALQKNHDWFLFMHSSQKKRKKSLEPQTLSISRTHNTILIWQNMKKKVENLAHKWYSNAEIDEKDRIVVVTLSIPFLKVNAQHLQHLLMTVR